jgi:RNA polymerase sigma-70 factor (ECF subfamily)
MSLTNYPSPAAAPALFERIQAGDHEAFNELYAASHARVLAAVRRYITEPDIAEYVVNGVFMKVWQFRNTSAAFQARSAFITWLTRIAITESLMHIRRCKPERARIAYSLDEPEYTGENTPGYGQTHKELPVRDLNLEGVFDRQILANALKQVPPTYRRVFQLRMIDGMSSEETGRILHLKVNAVKSRLFRGRQFLRDILMTDRIKVEIEADLLAIHDTAPERYDAIVMCETKLREFYKKEIDFKTMEYNPLLLGKILADMRVAFFGHGNPVASGSPEGMKWGRLITVVLEIGVRKALTYKARTYHRMAAWQAATEYLPASVVERMAMDDRMAGVAVTEKQPFGARYSAAAEGFAGGTDFTDPDVEDSYVEDVLGDKNDEFLVKVLRAVRLSLKQEVSQASRN